MGSLLASARSATGNGWLPHVRAGELTPGARICDTRVR